MFDPSGFPKSGRESVGVARQWCGRLGQTDNCQVAVFLGYVSRHEQTLVDMRLYLPEDWTKDAARMKKAGVPQGTKFRTRHELVLEMLAKHVTAVSTGSLTAVDEFDHLQFAATGAFEMEGQPRTAAVTVVPDLNRARLGDGAADRIGACGHVGL